MRTLDRKLFRDLWRLKGQVAAVAAVVASGVAVLVMSLAVIDALEETSRAYYERQRFGHVFADARRVPERLAERIAEIPGVQTVETRIVRFGLLDIEGFDEPVVAQIVSVPEEREPLLNRPVLLEGRSVTPGRVDEVVVSEPFAEAHGFRPGDRFAALLDGNRRTLTVVGIALSPEFVYAIGPGQLMPDNRRFGVLWMGRKALAAAYDLEGAFSNVSLTLLRGTDPEAVIDRLDTLLAPYGGAGAIARADQLSNWFLMNEIEQLRNMAAILPTIFLAVAAFLANMVLARLIALERTEIGLLKAFGFSSAAVAWHYVKLVMAMTGLGVVLGWALGWLLGRYNFQMYVEFYRFPVTHFEPGPGVFATATVVSLLAAVIGCLGSVRRAAALPPAEAMQPPAPPVFRRASGAFARLGGWLDQPTRIAFRQIVRTPLRAFLTSFGIGLSVAVLVLSLHWLDAIDRLIDSYFYEAQHQDATVGLSEIRPLSVTNDFARLPGVLAVEPYRHLATRLHHGNRSHRVGLFGTPEGARLSPIHDSERGPLPVPESGLVLSTKLAEILAAHVGDVVTVEALQGRRPIVDVPVVGTFETYIGAAGYMSLDAMNRMMRDPPVLSGVHLTIDPTRETELFRELKRIPGVWAVILRQAAIDSFRGTVAETIVIYLSFFVTFACVLAFGVVYNSARIALSERGRELATLRVLGFSRVDISYIMLAEIGVLVLVALPLGCATGAALAWFLTDSFETELFRIPFALEAPTLAYAIMIGIAASLVSAAVVRRRLDTLDLIAVLKTRE